MDLSVEFEWDDTKAETNLIKHGISFQAAAEVFADPDHIVLSGHAGLGDEPRSKAVGFIGDQLVCVVFTPRRSTIRLISARPANLAERKAHATDTLHP